MPLSPKHVRWLSVALSAIGVGMTSYKLLTLPLWGYWPLFWFLFFWILLISLLIPSLFKEAYRRELLGWSTISSFCLFLGFPTMPLTPLLFVAFVPLLWTLRKIQQDDRGRKGRRVLFYSYNTFFIWNVLSTFWVANTAFIAGIVAMGLNSFFMAGVVWIFFKIHDKFSRSFRYWVLAALWISFEYLHLHWEISWSWLNLGNAFAQTPRWIQWYEFTGIFGGTLWVWTLNIFFFTLWEQYQTQRLTNRIFQWGRIVLFITAPVIFSYILYHQYEEEGTPLLVATVQPNFEPHYEKFDISSSVQMDRFLNLSEACITDETDLLLFPETSFGPFDVDKLTTYPEIRRLYSFIERHPHLSIITGLTTYRLYNDENVPDGKDYREYPQQNGETIYLETQNSAVILNSKETFELYLKSKLVPGAEIFPYKEFLPFLEPIVKKLGGSLSDWGSQEIRSTFDADGVRVAPVICYESVFGEYCGGYIKQGAEMIAVVTNDGWWDETMGHVQHALFSRLRAIEYRRPVVRSANMGWSCFIDQRGNISMQNEYGAMGCVQSQVLANQTITTYARWGDMIARVACFLVILAILSAWMKKYRE